MNTTLSENDLARLRHDLRTPINHILGYSELIEEELAEIGKSGLSGDLQKIQRAAKSLLEMVNNRLSEDGSEEPVRETFETSEPSSTDALDLDVPPAGSKRNPLGKILVVDDRIENCEVLERHLRRHGHEPVCVQSGRDALRHLREDGFDLVLLDVLMPGMDGPAVLREMKADSELRHIPVIMISALDRIESVVQCIEAGAEDYLPKPFNRTLLRARIEACLEKKALRDQEQAYLAQIQASQERLSQELHEAANYVRSILPEPITTPLSIDWRYLPSTELGGDSFGYHWIDDDHFCVYLLDVCGHGVGASLLSVAASNVLRSRSLSGTNFRDPAQVLQALNIAFPMDRQNDMYFTIWYGVFKPSCGELYHSSGGHPPAILISPDGSTKELREPGLVVGAMPATRYRTGVVQVTPGSRLYIVSDGAYEIRRENREMVGFEEFVSVVEEVSACPDSLDRLIGWARQLHGEGPLDDDLSLLQVQFPATQ